MAELPVLQPKEKLQTNVGIPNVQGSLYLEPSMLATIGTQVAQSASIQLATNRGYELGQTPQGELLPPVTKTDEAFVRAYSAQAQTTLGLQAQRMMSESQNELLKLNRLTPADISNYEQNVAQGFQSILQNAPSTIRPDLANSFSQSLLNTTDQLNAKYIKQQKQENLQNFKSYTEKGLEQIYNSAVMGYDNQEQLDRYYRYIEDNVDNGLITRVEADSLLKSVALTSQTGVYINAALEAKNTGELEQYLSDLGELKNKPDNMSVTDWQTVGDNVYKYLQHVGKLESDQVNAKISRIENEIRAGNVDFQDLSDLQNDPQVSQAKFNRVMGLLQNRRSQMSEKDIRRNSLIQNPGSVEVFARSKPEDINAVYDDYLKQALEKGVSPEQARINAATQFAGPIPVLNNEVNLAYRQGVPEAMFQASNVIQALNDRGEASKLELSEQAVAAHTTFKNMYDATQNIDMAAKAAYDTAYNKTNDQRQLNNQTWKDYKKSKLNTPAQKRKLTKEILGLSSIPGFRVEMQNEVQLQNQVEKALEQFWNLTDGNIENAKESVSLAMRPSYGESNVNGRRQYMFSPVEKKAGVGFQAAPVIQKQAIEQLMPQLEATKKDFDEGRANYYYRIKNADAFNWEEKSANVRELYEKVNARDLSQMTVGEASKQSQSRVALEKQYIQAVNELEDMKKGRPIEIELIQRGGKPITYHADITADPLLAISSNPANPIVGPYTMRLRNDKNVIQPMLPTNAFNQQRVVFNPDLDRIRRDYNLMSGQSFVPPVYNADAVKAVALSERRGKIPRSGEQSPFYRQGLGL